MNNRVWIEIDKNADDLEKQVELTNQMLKKLGVTDSKFQLVKDHRDPDRKILLYVLPDGTYYECTDWGHWLNLDYLAK